ncbi:MAG: glycosyltransferase [Collinsella sp.]
MTDKMTVAIAAGGTAGHINPALALAESCVTAVITFCVRGPVAQARGPSGSRGGFDFVPDHGHGLRSLPSWTALTSLWRVNKAKRAPPSFLEGRQARCRIGFGAYVEVRCWVGARTPAFRICCTSRTLFRSGQ